MSKHIDIKGVAKIYLAGYEFEKKLHEIPEYLA